MNKSEARFRKLYPGVVAALEQQGWTIALTKKSHLKFITPDGKAIYGSGTPSDFRSDANFIAQMKREGLKLDAAVERDYRAPAPLPLPAASVAAMAAAEKPDEYWTSKRTAEFLGATPEEVAEWRDAEFLKEELDVPASVKRGRGRYFLRSTVEAFAESEEYRIFRVEHKKRRPPEAFALPESRPVEKLKVLLYRGELVPEEASLEQLAALVADAVAPRIEGIISAALQSYFRKIEW